MFFTMFLNLFIKDAYSNLLFNAKKAKKIGKSKIKIEFKKKKSKHQLSLLDVILNAIERKKTSCFYEVIGAENYEKVKREAIWKGYDVKDAGFLRKSNLKNDPNGTFTMEVSSAKTPLISTWKPRPSGRGGKVAT